MATASTLTKLPLDRFAFYLGMNPLHFNGVFLESLPGLPHMCGEPLRQYAWQAAEAVGREDIAIAIREAEDLIEEWVGYYLMPTWTVDERQLTTAPANRQLLNLASMDVRGRWKQVELAKGYFHYGGVRAVSTIELAAAIVYTETRGYTGYNDLATVTVAVAAGTDPQEVRVFYPGTQANPLNEIRPVNVSVSGLVATITFNREQAVLQSIIDSLVPGDPEIGGVDGTDNANFLATVDVYRVYNDPAEQATLEWVPLRAGDLYSCACQSATCTACQIGSAAGCMVARDPRLGLVAYQPGTWDADTESYTPANLGFCREPDRLLLSHYSGWEMPGTTTPATRMDPYWERAVSYLAASMLNRNVCGCDNVKAFTDLLQTDRSRSGEGYAFSNTSRQLENPFGITEGALRAWKAVNGAGRRIGGKQ